MSDMDEMVGAFFASPHTPLNRDEDEPWVVLAIAAALAAAPAAGGSVWCEHFHDVVLTLHGTGCPGPHRTLLLGPEVSR